MPVPRVMKRLVELSDLERAIVEAYEKDPRVADWDKRLLLAIWEREGLKLVLKQRWAPFRGWFLTTATMPEAITRAGRRLRAEGIIKASPEAERARQEMKRQYLKRFRHGQATAI